MPKVTINAPKTPVTKGSMGIAAATMPNVCKMPGPPAPFVPTPLPNIGKSGDSPQDYSISVTIEGEPVAIRGATFGSMGDIASQGTGGGLISSNTQGRTKFVGPGSMNVKIEGRNVQLLGDPMLNNCGPSGSPPNAATMTGIIQAPGMMTVIYGDDQPCGRCGKTHPLEAGNETLGMIRTLTKALRREFDAQKGRIKELNGIYTNLHEEERLCLKLEAKERKHGLTPTETAQLACARTEMGTLKTQAETLQSFFKGNALMRWERTKKTYARGYMLGVSICICACRGGKGRKLAASSGNAPPAFARVVAAAGFECASPPVMPGAIAEEGWSCAAKQIMGKLQGHRPAQLIERWFSPLVNGLKLSKGPLVSFSVLIEDPATKALRVETRSQRFGSGQNVPSCDKCQANLPAMYCDTRCG